MFGTLKLRFCEDILAILAWRLFGLLYEKTANFFFKSSGHPAFKSNNWGQSTSAVKFMKLFFS
jgi:hypothetical protein